MSRAKASHTSIRLVIPSQIRLVDLVHTASEQMAQLAGFDSEHALNMGIAVREAVINAITHGNKKDPARTVDITLVANGSGIEARVCDQGNGFDPGKARDPTKQENLLESSGRGLLMIRAFVDDVAFRYRKGRGMEVRLIKHI